MPYAVIEAYANDGVAGGFAVDGSPSSRIQLAPADRSVTLLTQAIDNVPGPDVQGLANLDYSLEDQGGTMWHRLNVVYQDNLAEIYPVLCAILDRIQLNRDTFAQAVTNVLSGLGAILAGRGGLSPEKQIGLYGELTTLISLAAQTNANQAVKAWRGPDREEHDFSLTECDLEVKTTVSEKRSHWISSLSQLTPSPSRSLYVLSIQLTASGAGPGLTLSDLVDVARALPSVPSMRLEQLLDIAEYHDRHADLYRTRWRFRSTPGFYLVDDQFPTLTIARVAAVVPLAERIEDVRYRVNLDGLAQRESLFPIEQTGIIS